MAATKARNISRRTRYEVFERDAFKCRYCGRGAPDVVLYVDHYIPVVAGDDDEKSNLLTACEACNLGKGGIRPIVSVSGIELSEREAAAFVLGNFVALDFYAMSYPLWGEAKDRAMAAVKMLSEIASGDDKECVRCFADLELTLWRAFREDTDGPLYANSKYHHDNIEYII